MTLSISSSTCLMYTIYCSFSFIPSLDERARDFLRVKSLMAYAHLYLSYSCLLLKCIYNTVYSAELLSLSLERVANCTRDAELILADEIVCKRRIWKISIVIFEKEKERRQITLTRVYIYYSASSAEAHFVFAHFATGLSHAIFINPAALGKTSHAAQIIKLDNFGPDCLFLYIHTRTHVFIYILYSRDEDSRGEYITNGASHTRRIY